MTVRPTAARSAVGGSTQAEGQELAGLQRFLRELSEAAGAAAGALLVAADRTCGWGWLPYRALNPEVADATAKVREFIQTRSDSPSVPMGTVAAGVEGFRQSHREAESAHRVAMVGKREPTVIAATDPGVSVAGLLSGDITDTRAWVAKVLGDLAGDDENDARLRETLRVFLGYGSSYKVAAEELNLHFNTVKYRVGRAVARRGSEIGKDRLDVELALLVCHWYDPVVLQAALQPK
jgi:DNA-binding PucR family transcriptional regulator